MAEIAQKIRGLLRHASKKISNIVRGTVLTVATLLGIKWSVKGRWNLQAAISAAWIFIIGVPIGILFVGAENFSMPIWLIIVMTLTALANLEDGLALASNFIEHGIDGVVDDDSLPQYAN